MSSFPVLPCVHVKTPLLLIVDRGARMSIFVRFSTGGFCREFSGADLVSVASAFHEFLSLSFCQLISVQINKDRVESRGKRLISLPIRTAVRQRHELKLSALTATSRLSEKKFNTRRVYLAGAAAFALDKINPARAYFRDTLYAQDTHTHARTHAPSSPQPWSHLRSHNSRFTSPGKEFFIPPYLCVCVCACVDGCMRARAAY